MNIIQSGSVFYSNDYTKHHSVLPAGNYDLDFNMIYGWHFQTVPNPVKVTLYGNTINVRKDKIITSYLSRTGKNTGVLFSGNKGSGKTLLCNEIIIELMEKYNIPCINIKGGFEDFAPIDALKKITQPAIIFIDEFEKKFSSHEEQNLLLSFLDGDSCKNKLVMFSTNCDSISEFLLDRPSRIFYHFNYQKIDRETVDSYCTEKLKNTDHKMNILKLWRTSVMSFDILQSLVEELNRYPDQDFVHLLRDMNVSVAKTQYSKYDIAEFELMGKKETAYLWTDEFILTSMLNGFTNLTFNIESIKFSTLSALMNQKSVLIRDASNSFLAQYQTGTLETPDELECNVTIVVPYNRNHFTVTDNTILFDDGVLKFQLYEQTGNDIYDLIFS